MGDPRGEKIGSVKRIWLAGQTGDPLWASVHTGLFGHKESRSEEQLKIGTEQVETGRVRLVALTKETVTDQETVSGTVRKEHIDVEDSRQKR